MFDNILLVCVGNICRSPSAERVLRTLLPGKTIHSAGLGALEGKGIDPSAAALLAEHDIDHEQHIARQLTGELVAKADLILVMEKGHQQAVAQRYPQASGKTMLLGKWLDEAEIPDPYKKSREAFEFAYQQIDKACHAWAKRL